MKKFPGKYFDKFIASTIAVSMLCISMPQQMMAENYYIQSDKICDGLDEESTQQAQEFVQGVQQLIADGENTGVNVIVKSTEILNDDSATACVDNGYNDLYVFQYENKEKANAALESFKNTDGVIYAEIERELSIEDEADEEIKESRRTNIFDNSNWGISMMHMQEYNAFVESVGKEPEENVIVAVVDTGISEDSNEVFSGRVLEGASFTYMDKSQGGLSFGQNKYSTTNYTDDNGHGTGVSGIIAQSTCENVKILPVKALDAKGSGSDLAVYTGVLYAITEGADVVNLSCGADGQSLLYEDMLNQAEQSGVNIVVAAGNESQNVENVSPASIPYSITVSSIDKAFGFSSFSNYGSTVDFTAPGSNVLLINYKGGYKTSSGTSFSAPLISSVIAELLCANPDFTNDEVFEIMKTNATDLGEEGWDEKFDYGWIDMENLEDDVIPYVVVPDGDVNGDNEVDMSDALLVLKAADKDVELEFIQQAHLGVYDGEVTVSHALKIMKYIVGKTQSYSDN